MCTNRQECRLTNERDESFLFVSTERVVPSTFRQSTGVGRAVYIAAELTLEVLLPELAEPGVATVEDSVVFYHVATLLRVADFAGAWSQRLEIAVETLQQK